jgi:hypothetical protein
MKSSQLKDKTRSNNKALNSTFTNVFDMYLTTALRSTRLQRAPKAGSSQQRLVLWGVLCFQAVGLISAEAKTTSTTEMFKLYAHSQLLNDEQYKCFVSIINKENRSWDINARNGSHYGLGQMRSTHYKTLDGYRQIDATIRYINVRYGSMCNAWRFHTKRNFY